MVNMKLSGAFRRWNQDKYGFIQNEKNGIPWEKNEWKTLSLSLSYFYTHENRTMQTQKWVDKK
jgi:hypothetical protein